MWNHDLALFGRIALAAGLGYAVGWEREVRGHPAGSRTFALVAAVLGNGAGAYLKRTGVLQHAAYQAYWAGHCAEMELLPVTAQELPCRRYAPRAQDGGPVLQMKYDTADIGLVHDLG